MSAHAPTISEQLAALDASPFWPREIRAERPAFDPTTYTAPTRIEAIDAEIARLKYADSHMNIADHETRLRAELSTLTMERSAA